jgi:surfeit locus 1 family protein
MRIAIFGREFTPSLLMTVIAAAGFALFCVLGLWQLQRADLKREIEQRFRDQFAEPYRYVVLDAEVNPLLQYKKIQLSGHYAPQFTLLLDNQVFKQQVGYQVLTPFFINKNQAVLVNRGWVALGNDRAVLPDIIPPENNRQLQGIVTIPSTAGLRMGEVVVDGRWPLRIPYIDLKKIQQGVDFELLPYVVWLSEDADDVYLRKWQPIWSSPEKSEAYALQWFSFAAIVLILFVALNLKKTGENNE